MIENKDLAAMRALMKNAGGGTGGGGTSIDVTAQVGQTIVVKEVDANGKPTAWESADYQPRTHWEEEVVCMPEATYGATQLTIETSFVPVVGESYKVIWNGVEYVCVCFAFTAETTVPCLGNIGLSDSEYENTGEPFFLAFGDGACVRNLVDGNVSPDTFSITHLRTTKIPPKYLPEGIGYSEKTTILPETTIETPIVSDQVVGVGVLPDMAIVAGETYNIMYNGVEYVCECFADEDLLILGNFDGTATEPFMMVYGGNEGDDYSWMLGTLDGSTSVTLSITADVVTKLPTKYIDDAWVKNIAVSATESIKAELDEKNAEQDAAIAGLRTYTKCAYIKIIRSDPNVIDGGWFSTSLPEFKDLQGARDAQVRITLYGEGAQESTNYLTIEKHCTFASDYTDAQFFSTFFVHPLNTTATTDNALAVRIIACDGDFKYRIDTITLPGD